MSAITFFVFLVTAFFTSIIYVQMIDKLPYYISKESLITICLLFTFCVSFWVNELITFLRKVKNSYSFLLLMPSSLIPLLAILTVVIPFYLSVQEVFINFEGRAFSFFKYSDTRFFDESILYISLIYFLLLLAIGFSKRLTLQKYYLMPLQVRLNQRLFDNILSRKFLLKSIPYIISLAVFSVPILLKSDWDQLLNTDLIWEGTRQHEQMLVSRWFDSGDMEQVKLDIFLRTIASSLGMFISLYGGYAFAKTHRYEFLTSVVIITIPRMAVLSRGSFLFFFVFFIVYVLMSKEKIHWIYLVLVSILALMSSSIALNARASPFGGGIRSFLDYAITSVTDWTSYLSFFEINNNLGLLTVTFAMKDAVSYPIDSFSLFLLEISPLPSRFFSAGADYTTGIDTFLGIKVGLPLIAFGNLYIRLGWWSLLFIVLVGWFIGKLEASLLVQEEESGYPYWVDVFLWLSILFGFMMSIHTSVRACTRLFLYIYMIKSIAELIFKYKYKYSKKSVP